MSDVQGSEALSQRLGFFLFSKTAVSLELLERGASERLSLQGKFCLAFLENCPFWQKQKAQDNGVRCLFLASISSSVTVLSHI